MEERGCSMNKKGMALIIIVSLMISTFADTGICIAGKQENIYTYDGEGFEVVFQVQECWSAGYKASITINNPTHHKVRNWGLSFDLGSSVQSIWNAQILEEQKGYYVVKGDTWNQNIDPGDSVSFSFLAEGDFVNAPSEYVLTSSKKLVRTSDYSILCKVSNCWEQGFNENIQIQNISLRYINICRMGTWRLQIRRHRRQH